MTINLRIPSDQRTYDVIIGDGLLGLIPSYLRSLDVAAPMRLHLISDENLKLNGHVNQVELSCTAAGYQVSTSIVPAGDASKSLDIAKHLYRDMLAAGVRRNGVVLALGGGMIGDLAGFVAATYLRGVRLIQLPTTLLAHDSSIGGKVGINLDEGKNLVGAFYPPIAVIYDMDTLRTLPNREWINGMAEVIKHAVIGDSALFSKLEQLPATTADHATLTSALIAQAMAVKITIISEDEYESGKRMWLNMGHNIAHAIEQVTHYGISHGEAVAIGMCVESEIAVLLDLLPVDEFNRITRLLNKYHLPVTPPDINLALVIDALQLDKKNREQGMTFVLPRYIGCVEINCDVTEELVRIAWQKVQEVQS